MYLVFNDVIYIFQTKVKPLCFSVELYPTYHTSSTGLLPSYNKFCCHRFLTIMTHTYRRKRDSLEGVKLLPLRQYPVNLRNAHLLVWLQCRLRLHSFILNKDQCKECCNVFFFSHCLKLLIIYIRVNSQSLSIFLVLIILNSLV